MTLPVSGPISLADVNTELGLSSTAQIDMNSSAVRTLFAVPSGAISMSNGYGKANAFAFTISSNQTNANLATLATTAGWNGTTKVVATVGSGVYISSNSTGTPALTISGSFPNGVELINNGYIVGLGGAGGNGSSHWVRPSTSGAAGGLALSVSSAISINNAGTIAGGGGGGGGGGGSITYYSEPTGDCCFYVAATGGGGGGGRSSNAANSSGGTGNATGGAGTVSAAGSGGSGGTSSASGWGIAYGGAGGAGGGWGSTGTTGTGGSNGGSRTQPGSAGYSGASGGSGGGAVSGNSNITWIATGTRLGSIA